MGYRSVNSFILVVTFLSMACSNHCFSSGIERFIGRDVEVFIKESSLTPVQVIKEGNFRNYLFEIKYLEKIPTPSDVPIKPQNLNNTTPPVLLNSNKDNNYFSFESPRATPGSPEFTSVHYTIENKTCDLIVNTNLSGIILNYRCIHH